jgi:type IV secretory pathway protease TraF
VKGKSSEKEYRPKRLILSISAAGLTALALATWLSSPWKLIYNPSESAPLGWYLQLPPGHLHVGQKVLARLPRAVAGFAAARAYLPLEIPILKPIAAVSGQRVCEAEVAVTPPLFVTPASLAPASLAPASLTPPSLVTPAKAGVQSKSQGSLFSELDSGFRRNDGKGLDSGFRRNDGVFPRNDAVFPHILIDGRPVARIHQLDGAGRPLPHWNGCRTLERNEVFLLSRYSTDSFDSRYFGPIDRSAVIGKVIPLWTW